MKLWTYQTYNLTLTQGEHRKSPEHTGNTPEVKITPGIILTGEVHDKNFRGRPPKVKWKNTARVRSADNNADNNGTNQHIFSG